MIEPGSVRSSQNICAVTTTRNAALFESLKFVVVVFELAVLLFLLHKFKIESELGFPRILPFIFAGFVISSLLPIRFRPAFSVLLFAATLVWVIGFPNSLLVIGIGTGLIGICHLPVSFVIRVLLLLLAGLFLAVMRMNWLVTSWGNVVIPLIGSMFMFRLISYTHALRLENAKTDLWQRVSYFFLLPNICFPLFPIIGYQNFLACYYERQPFETYLKGVRWILWGTIQLLIYRVIYYWFVPAPSVVTDLKSLILYCVTAYLLLLKIAGQGYLILGVLCLFGYDLPPMFNNYFLAEGPSDLWRKVNLYWRDFITKIFYNSFFLRMRKLGLLPSVIVSLLATFLVTWLLHSYQFFWIQGTFPINARDGIFWGAFGLLVTGSSLLQIRQKRAKSVGEREWKFRKALKRSMKTVFFFCFMCVLFSFWTSSSIKEWSTAFAVLWTASAQEITLICIILLIAVLCGIFLQHPVFKRRFSFPVNHASFYSLAFTTFLVLSFVLLIRSHRLYFRGTPEFGEIMMSLENPGWNKRDAERIERGYYAPLLEKNQFGADLASGILVSPAGWDDLIEIGGTRSVNNMLIQELAPSRKIIFKGAEFTTNKWGMRDLEYSRNKPPGTFRFALVGTSIEMGSGVGDNKTFEALVEQRLNRQDRNDRYSHFEILNFSCSQYSTLRYLKVCETKVFAFQPNVLFCSIHPVEAFRSMNELIDILYAGHVENEFLRGILQEASVTKDTSRTEANRRLMPYKDRIFEWSLKGMYGLCRQNGTVPVMLLIPTLNRHFDSQEVRVVQDLGRRLGFLVLNASYAFDNQDPLSLRVRPWDIHPNEKGHQIIADLVYEKIVKNAEALRFVSSHTSANLKSEQNE